MIKKIKSFLKSSSTILSEDYTIDIDGEITHLKMKFKRKDKFYFLVKEKEEFYIIGDWEKKLVRF